MAYKDGEVNHISSGGPWGGQHGRRWDDGVHSAVRQVVIAISDAIDSIRFEYDDNGHSVWSDKHGGDGGLKLYKIKLDWPNEYLASISGHYGSVSELDAVVVRSLSFESNRKKYGPFGVQEGTSFSLPIPGRKLAGFHGRSGWYLDSIGVYTKPLLQHAPIATRAAPANPEASNKVKVVTYGPWGGPGGSTFDDGKNYTGVRGITLTRTGCLVSIQVCYDQNGERVWGVKNGGNVGIYKDKIVFDYPNELLTHITGYYSSTMLRGPTVVKSITFHTTKMKYGPFGVQQGVPFSSGSGDGVIVGFHGKRYYFIDSIGVHVVPGRPVLPGVPANPLTIRDPVRYEAVPPREVRSETGPWGGDGGRTWDDGASYTGIRKIVLTRGLGEAICSIQVEYERNGKFVWSDQHGHPNNSCTYLITFKYPCETLTGVSGYYGFVGGRGGGSRVLRSITFYTNVAKYGPFGEKIGTPFSSAAEMEGKVVGFHGRSGVYLDAIGIHMQQQWMGNKPNNGSYWAADKTSGNHMQQQWMGNKPNNSSYWAADETSGNHMQQQWMGNKPNNSSYWAADETSGNHMMQQWMGNKPNNGSYWVADETDAMGACFNKIRLCEIVPARQNE